MTGSRISVRRAFANQFKENIDMKTEDRVMEKGGEKGVYQIKIREILNLKGVSEQMKTLRQ